MIKKNGEFITYKVSLTLKPNQLHFYLGSTVLIRRRVTATTTHYHENEAPKVEVHISPATETIISPPTSPQHVSVEVTQQQQQENMTSSQQQNYNMSTTTKTATTNQEFINDNYVDNHFDDGGECCCF